MIIKEIPNFPNYVMYEDGNVQNIKTKNFLKMDKKFCYALVNCGKVKRFSIKTLYKLVFNKNFCYDYIEKINDDEVFKDIPGTKGLFQISNYARVKSLKGIYAKILKSFVTTKGYCRIEIEYNGERKKKFVHVLVAETFLEKPQGINIQVHHKNFNSQDNRLSNLEYLGAIDHLRKHNERRAKENE